MLKKNRLAVCVIAGMALLAGCKNEQITDLSNNVITENSEKDILNSKDYSNENKQYTVDEIKTKLINQSVYDETYINEITKTVNTINCTANDQAVSYVFITDTHIGKEGTEDEILYKQIQAAVDVANNSEADFLCLGGDIEDGRFSQENGGKQKVADIWKNVTDILKGCTKPVFILKGNHDDNSFSAQADGNLLFDPDYILTNAEWYDETMANFSQYATDYHDGYFYYDIPDKNTRVVCLNMSNSSDEIVDGKRIEMGMYYYGYHDEQMEWLLNSALSKEDCRYIFLCHDAFDYPEGYNENTNRDVLANILKAAYTHTKFETDKFSKDFTNWTGRMLLFNNGHMHMEKYMTLDIVGGLPLLSTEAAAIYNYNRTNIANLPSPWNTYSRTEGREAGSVKEAAFDIIISNSSLTNNGNGSINVIKFGNGEDKIYNK